MGAWGWEKKVKGLWSKNQAQQKTQDAENSRVITRGKGGWGVREGKRRINGDRKET